MVVDAPRSDLDLWADDVLVDPYPAYALLRDLGPVVWLDRHDVVALTRYDDIRAVLRDWQVFRSGHGVGVEAETNRRSSGTGVLTSDPPDHDPLRRMLNRQLGSHQVAGHVPFLEQRADVLVAGLVARRRFDPVGDLAGPYSVGVVADLVGLPEVEREHLLDRAARSFNTMGPDNRRLRQSQSGLRELFEYCRVSASPDRLEPGRWGSEIYAAARGELDEHQCLSLIMAYAWAGMDTTVNAIASAVALFADHPDQWQRLRQDRSLLTGAVNEVLRIEPVVQRFTRRAEVDTEIAGFTVPAGSRVLLLFGSANRDPSHYPHPDRFDIARNPHDHLGFGRGIHRCVGAPLAQHEMAAVLSALIDRVRRFRVVDRVRLRNNALHGYERLTVEAD